MLDHFLVIALVVFRGCHKCLLVVGQGSARASKCFGGDVSALNGRGGRVLPRWMRSPIDVGTVAAAVSATIATA